MRFAWRTTLVLGLLLLCLPLAVQAAEERLSPEEMAKIEGELVPSPAELFVAVSRMGDYDWDSVVTSNTNTEYKNNYLRALNLGVRSADGFLAIQAQDARKLGEIINTILTLSRALAVDEPILAKGSELHALATNKRWKDIRQELDVLRGQVENFIKQLGDDQSALLVSAGGWLEGLRAVTKLLSEQYDGNASTIMHQPGLVDYFNKRFNGLDDKYKNVPQVKAITEKLPEIQKLLKGEPGKPIPKENIEKLYTIATELVLAIERG